MFPIRDHNPSGRTPYVTYALILSNILIFLGYWGGSERDVQMFFLDWAMIPARLSYGEGWHTLLSSMFLHGGWLHLAGNMLFLFIFGDNMEDEMGHAGFAVFYIVCGFGAGLAQYLTNTGSTIPTVGASGAIAGVMGGYLLLFPRAKVDILLIFIIFFKVFQLPAFVVLGIWFALQVIAGVGAQADVGGVAYWAHAGGFVIGLGLTLPLWLYRGGPRFWDKTDGRPPHPDAEYTFSATRIPRVPRR